MLVVVGLVAIILQLTKLIDVMASSTDIFLWIAAPLIAIAVGLIAGTRRINSPSTAREIQAADSRFRKLVFHFSRKTDTPTGSHALPNFVEYKKTKKTKEAYPIPEYLEPYLKAVGVNCHPHDGIDNLNKYFETNGIHVNPNDPDYEDLGLIMGWDGFLHLPDLDWNELLTKLNGRKVKPERATIVKLYPWHRLFRSKPFHTDNRLLILHSKSPKEAWWTPFHDLDLIHSGLIDSSPGTKIHLSFWCWWHHYRYMPYHFDEDRLLELLGE